VEKRKVQLTGGSTYIISLPKQWAREMGVKEGDEITIERREDGSLVLVPASMTREEREEAVLEVSRDEDPEAIVRKVISLYLAGYNVIRVKMEDGRISWAQREALKGFVRAKMVGMEVTSDMPSEMVLQVLLSYPELSVKDALRRMYLISRAMREDAIASLEILNADLAKDVIARDDEVDRFGLYIVRQLESALEDPKLIKEIGLETLRDCLGYRIVAKTVERVSDHFVHLAQNVLQIRRALTPSVMKKIREMDNLVFLVFEEALTSLFGGDYVLAERALARRREIDELEQEAIRGVLKEVSGEDLMALRMIVESLRRVGEYGSDIAEIVLDLQVPRTVEG